MIKLGDVISLDKTIKVDIQDNIEYIIAGVQSYGKGVLNKRKELGINMTMKQYQLIEPNQLMWCKVDTKNGAFGITKSEHKGSLASTNMCLAKIKTDKILPEFLEKLFRIKFFHENITHLSSGTTNRKYLTPNQLCDLIYIPNFTIQEQKDFLQFVNKLESSPIFSHIDYQLTQLENLNQAILQEAVQGKLVKQDPKDEPASELLKRIKEEKAKSGKKEKTLSPIKPEEIPFEIPENWVWCRLGEITDIQRGSSPRPKGDPRYFSKSKTNYNWITISDISNFCEDNVLLQTREFLTEEGSKHSRYVDVNEFIIAVSGSTTGKCCITGVEGFIYDGLAVAKIIENSFDSRYLLNYMMCLYSTINNSKTGASFPNINTDYLNNLIFPLPPIKEQIRINKEIEKQFAKTKQLKEHIIANQQATEQLLKALLHQAFEVKEMEII